MEANANLYYLMIEKYLGSHPMMLKTAKCTYGKLKEASSCLALYGKDVEQSVIIYCDYSAQYFLTWAYWSQMQINKKLMSENYNYPEGHNYTSTSQDQMILACVVKDLCENSLLTCPKSLPKLKGSLDFFVNNCWYKDCMQTIEIYKSGMPSVSEPMKAFAILERVSFDGKEDYLNKEFQKEMKQRKMG